ILGGNTAHPATAIPRKDAPCLVFVPNPLIASAKMVGHIIDIKKIIPYNAIKEVQPNLADTIGNNTLTASAYTTNNFVGFTYFIIALPDIRPIINNANPMDKKYGPYFTSKRGCIS